MRIAALILAAGAGRRIGGPKALLRAGAETFLARCARVLASAGAAPLIAVLGHEADRVRSQAGLAPDVTIALNPDPDAGMLRSLLAGLDAAEAAGADAVLVHPVDHPLVTVACAERLLAALRSGARIAVPSYQGRRGHPGGFAAYTWPALRAASPAAGARALLRDHPDWIVHCEGDAGCLAGIDTPADYRRWMGREP